MDKATIDKITPHPLWAIRPADATIPVTAAGQARLIAREIFAVCKGGPDPTTYAIKGIASVFEIKPN